MPASSSFSLRFNLDFSDLSVSCSSHVSFLAASIKRFRFEGSLMNILSRKYDPGISILLICFAVFLISPGMSFEICISIAIPSSTNALGMGPHVFFLVNIHNFSRNSTQAVCKVLQSIRSVSFMSYFITHFD